MNLPPDIQGGLNYVFIAVVAWLGRAKADIILLQQSVKKSHERIDALEKKAGIRPDPAAAGDEKKE